MGKKFGAFQADEGKEVSAGTWFVKLENSECTEPLNASLILTVVKYFQCYGDVTGCMTK